MPEPADSHDDVQREAESLRRRVAELEHAETQLAEWRELMHYIIRHDPNAITVYDNDLNYIFVSERYLNDYRVQMRDIIGKHHYEVFPEMPERWRAVHQRVLAGAVERADEDHFERPDGTIDYNRWECRPWYRSDGTIGGMITYTEVINERKRAENALRDSEERYRALVETATDAIFVADPETGILLDVNRQAERLLGRTREEIIGLHQSAIHPPDPEGIYKRKFKQAVESKGHQFHEMLVVHSSGKLIPVEISSGGRVRAGSRDIHFGLFRDISERKAAERALRHSEHLLRQSQALAHVGSYSRDLATDRIDWSDEQYRLFGYEPGQVSPTFTLVRDHIHPDDRETWIAANEAIVNHDRPYDIEYRIITTNGVTRFVRSRAQLQRDADGRPVRQVGALQDITAQKRIETELRRHRDHLEELVAERTRELEESHERLRRSEQLASLGTLSAGIAHEINNPIGAVLLCAQSLLDQGDLPDHATRGLEDIAVHIRRAAAIIRSIRHFARTELTEKTPTNLDEVLDSVAGLVKQYVSRSNCELVIENQARPATINLNATAMEQVGVNLIRNAIEAGATRVNVAARKADGHVLMEFRDNGSGMTEEVSRRLFEPFFTTRHHEGGTGLGMSMVHGIVQDHDGRIEVRSRPGEGTTIVIQLPGGPCDHAGEETSDGPNPRA